MKTTIKRFNPLVGQFETIGTVENKEASLAYEALRSRYPNARITRVGSLITVRHLPTSCSPLDAGPL